MTRQRRKEVCSPLHIQRKAGPAPHQALRDPAVLSRPPGLASTALRCHPVTSPFTLCGWLFCAFGYLTGSPILHSGVCGWEPAGEDRDQAGLWRRVRYGSFESSQISLFSLVLFSVSTSLSQAVVNSLRAGAVFCSLFMSCKAVTHKLGKSPGGGEVFKK